MRWSVGGQIFRAKLTVGLMTLMGLMVVPAVNADTLNVLTTSGKFYSWNHATLGTLGGPFWNLHASYDGSQCGIGFWFDGSDVCNASAVAPGSAIPEAPVYPDFLAAATGQGTDVPFEFVLNPTGDAVELRVEVAGLNTSNRFGYYVGDSFTQLFSGPDNPSSAGVAYITLAPGTTFGFYLYTGDNVTYKTGTGTAFALFSSDHAVATGTSFIHTNLGTYWIGSEDRLGTDNDYNDLIVKVTAVPVPEPGSLLLLGAGLFGISAAAWRRKK